MASHVFAWIAGVCIAFFAIVGMWMSQSVWGIPLYRPTDDDWKVFATRRQRVPFRAWFGLGLFGCLAALVAAVFH